MQWKLTLALVLLALLGVLAITWLALPIMIDANTTKIPLATLQLATFAQSTLLVVLAAIIGSGLSTKVGLNAPVLSALVYKGDFLTPFRTQVLPAVIGGIIGAGIIVGFYLFAPEPLAGLQSKQSLPILSRVLYGGITEEVLIRWGLMSLLVWLGWRIFQGGTGAVSSIFMWLGIIISALVFGISHVPSAMVALGSLPTALILYITVGNALFGTVAGYLYWKYGLEAAIMAHMLAHVVAFLIHG